MLKSLLCDENNEFRVIEDFEYISDIVEHKERYLWLDVERPSPEEMRLIQEEFRLHPLAIEDATRRHQRPKVEQYSNFYFVIFYAVTLEEAGEAATAGRRGLKGTKFHEQEPTGTTIPGGESKRLLDDKDGSAQSHGSADERIVLREMSMFLGSNYLITVHEDPMPEFEEVSRRWYRNVEAMAAEMGGDNHLEGTRLLSRRERASLTPRSPENHVLVAPPTGEADEQSGKPAEAKAESPSSDPDQMDETYSAKAARMNDIGILLYSMLDTIVDGYFPVIDGIVERIEGLEEQIFERFNQGAIESVFRLKKDLLALRKVLAPERDVLNILTRRDLPVFEEHTLIYFQDVYDHVVRITDSIDTYRDLLSSALESYLSMQSNQLNITVQTLTSVSIMLMSIAAVTGWYGMNFAAMPELTSRFGYPWVMVVVAVVLAVEYIFFKRRGWL